MKTEKVSLNDYIRWGIEGSIKREMIIDKLINQVEDTGGTEEEFIQLYLKNNNIKTQEEISRWMLKENLDKSSLLTRAKRHAKWIQI